MRKNSKKKGNRGENQLVHILCERFGEGKFKRTPSSGAYVGGINKEAAKNLPFEAKITLVSDIITPSNFRFTIEHKFYNSIDFWELFSENPLWIEWLDQAERDAEFVNKLPLVVIKYNRHERISILKQDFLEKEMKRLNFNIDIPLTWKPNNKDFKVSVVRFNDLLKAPDGFWFD